MQKIFKEYGGIITAAIAVVAIVGVIALMFAPGGTGWMDTAFNGVVSSFSNKANYAIEGPQIIDGAGQKYIPGQVEPLVFRSDAPYDTFKSVMVDNEIVDSSQYTVTEGSTMVTFAEEYSSKLSFGKHTVAIVSNAGAAKADFTVANPALNPTGVTLTRNGIYDYGDYRYTVIYPDNVNQFGATTLDEAWEAAEYMLSSEGMTWDEFFALAIQEGLASNEEECKALLGLTEETFVPAIPIDCSVVLLADNTKTEYGPILESINGFPITDMSNTFKLCKSLKIAPTIPEGVTKMTGTFAWCTSLTTAPTIPEGVTDMVDTFSNCAALTTAPTIPEGVTNMRYTFARCTSLTTAPTIPEGVTDMTGTFENCTSLKTAPIIPSTVTDMDYTFFSCTALTTATTIPEGVTKMTCTFSRCSSLTGTIPINANPTFMDGCFSLLSAGKDITLTGTSSKLQELANTSDSSYRTIYDADGNVLN